MDRRAAIATYRLAFAVLTIGAITVQLLDLSAKGTLNLASYFSYFTIESNLIATAVLRPQPVETRAALPSAARCDRVGSIPGPGS